MTEPQEKRLAEAIEKLIASTEEEHEARKQLKWSIYHAKKQGVTLTRMNEITGIARDTLKRWIDEYDKK